MSIVVIPSIQIPSNEMLVEKEFICIHGGIFPLEEDNSTWSTVIYELWGIESIKKDLKQSIEKLESMSLDEVDSSILNIKEGIKIFEERLGIYINGYMKQIYVKNIQYLLNFKEIRIEMKRKEIDWKKEQLIKRMEKFRQDLETRQVNAFGDFGDIDKEKKEINKETSEIRKMGADRKCLKQIGLVMKTVYNQISKFLM